MLLKIASFGKKISGIQIRMYIEVYKRRGVSCD